MSQRERVALASQGATTGIALRCPRCAEPMGELTHEEDPLSCSCCKVSIPCERGVWRSLLPERAAHFTRFVEDYQIIRGAEGRGSTHSDYYLALPERDLSGRNRTQWAIRARTFRYMVRHILPRLTSLSHPRLHILDLGAGNGWLSYRLAMQGHATIAVDLMTNDHDGLEAAEHYRKSLPRLFPRFQAEVDNLPFAEGQFDLVIFNASFHYSEDYEKTMAEAFRCTRTGGTIIIADTGWYRDEQSGVRMLEERRALFIKRYGFPSDGLSSLEYLTDRRLARLATRFGIQWQVHAPYYGWRWQLRPWLAKLRGQRTPSEFRIYVARANS